MCELIIFASLAALFACTFVYAYAQFEEISASIDLLMIKGGAKASSLCENYSLPKTFLVSSRTCCSSDCRLWRCIVSVEADTEAKSFVGFPMYSVASREDLVTPMGNSVSHSSTLGLLSSPIELRTSEGVSSFRSNFCRSVL